MSEITPPPNPPSMKASMPYANNKDADQPAHPCIWHKTGFLITWPTLFQEVLTVYEIVRSQFRGANITASTFEAFIELMQPFKSRLPVFTQEMGDVWIQGSGSDPRKTAIMRAMFRARTGCFQQGMETIVLHTLESKCTEMKIFWVLGENHMIRSALPMVDSAGRLII